jgi:hypothetical protein
MYFNHRLFFKAEYLALFRSPFRLRRWCYVLFFSGLFLLFLSFVVMGRALDHVFFSRFNGSRSGIQYSSSRHRALGRLLCKTCSAWMKGGSFT